MSPLPALPDKTEMEARGEALVCQVRALAVVDTTSHALAAEYALLAAMMEREIHEQEDPVCQATDHAHKLAVAKRGRLLALPLEVKRLAGSKATEYEREQQRRRREAEEAQRLERERLEQEERDRVAAETERRRKDEEDRRLAEAASAEARGDTAAAEQIIAQPIAVPTVQARPVFVPPVTVPLPPKVAGLSSRMDWDFEITDATQIPREYMMIDFVAIRRVCKALKDKTRIPGIRAVEKPVTSVRA